MNYPAELYEQTRNEVQSSAAAVVPLLYALFKPKTVLDVGCGEGWWAKEFQNQGALVAGIDGEHVEPVIENFHVRDLEEHLSAVAGWLAADDAKAADPKADLVLCLEVAEHLSPGRAESFVHELTASGKTVVFSAAIPGQGGAGHVNEQWPDYWVKLFRENGYSGTGGLRGQIWNDDAVAPWYRQNLFVFGDLGPLDPGRCVALVHPEIWSWYR
jgi:SAM-dependent methyltransferase